jgi:hypothetical protein
MFGEVQGLPEPQDDTLYIVATKTSEKYRGNGVNKHLLEEALKKISSVDPARLGLGGAGYGGLIFLKKAQVRLWCADPESDRALKRGEEQSSLRLWKGSHHEQQHQFRAVDGTTDCTARAGWRIPTSWPTGHQGRSGTPDLG